MPDYLHDFQVPKLSLKYIHNMVVHYPLAYGILALAVLAIAMRLHRPNGYALWRALVAITWVSVLLAVVSGHMTAEHHKFYFTDAAWVSANSELATNLLSHRFFGFATLALCTLATVPAFRKMNAAQPKPTIMNWLALVLTAAMVGVMYFTAHIGGNLGV